MRGKPGDHMVIHSLCNNMFRAYITLQLAEAPMIHADDLVAAARRIAGLQSTGTVVTDRPLCERLLGVVWVVYGVARSSILCSTETDPCYYASYWQPL